MFAEADIYPENNSGVVEGILIKFSMEVTPFEHIPQ
jgi:hypothetical protein